MLRWWLGLTLLVFGLGFLAMSFGALEELPEYVFVSEPTARLLGMGMLLGAAGLAAVSLGTWAHRKQGGAQAPGEGRTRTTCSARDGWLVFLVLPVLLFPLHALLTRWFTEMPLGSWVTTWTEGPLVAIAAITGMPSGIEDYLCLVGLVLAYGSAGALLGAALSPLNRSRVARIVLICSMGLVFVAMQAIFLHYWPAPFDLVR